jgi:hypothetical protein
MNNSKSLELLASRKIFEWHAPVQDVLETRILPQCLLNNSNPEWLCREVQIHSCLPKGSPHVPVIWASTESSANSPTALTFNFLSAPKSTRSKAWNRFVVWAGQVIAMWSGTLPVSYHSSGFRDAISRFSLEKDALQSIWPLLHRLVPCFMGYLWFGLSSQFTFRDGPVDFLSPAGMRVEGINSSPLDFFSRASPDPRIRSEVPDAFREIYL